MHAAPCLLEIENNLAYLIIYNCVEAEHCQIQLHKYYYEILVLFYIVTAVRFLLTMSKI